MVDINTMVVQPRKDFGKSAAKVVRKNGLVPCVLHEKSSTLSYSINQKELFKVLMQNKFFLRSYDILDGSNGDKVICKAMARQVQFDPVTNAPIHMDLMRVDDNSSVIVHMPVVFRNSDKAPGLKEGGQMKIYLNSIKMRVAFSKMPQFIELDLGKMSLNDVISIKDLSLPEGCVLLQSQPKDKVAFMKANRAEAS